MAWEDIQGRKYDPVGRCIYCGSDGGSEGLTDEHIVPLSLGGDAVLRKASCRRCATITSQTELYLGRSIFHELRSHVGAPSRRRTLPTSLSANISVGDQEITREFLAADQPFALMLPIWDWPGIMRQVQPSAEFPVYNVRAYNFMPSTLRETLGLPEDAPDPLVHVASGSIDNVRFARAIAKIAYCGAVAKYGAGGFRPLATGKSFRLCSDSIRWCTTRVVDREQFRRLPRACSRPAESSDCVCALAARAIARMGVG